MKLIVTASNAIQDIAEDVQNAKNFVNQLNAFYSVAEEFSFKLKSPLSRYVSLGSLTFKCEGGAKEIKAVEEWCSKSKQAKFKANPNYRSGKGVYAIKAKLSNYSTSSIAVVGNISICPINKSKFEVILEDLEYSRT